MMSFLGPLDGNHNWEAFNITADLRTAWRLHVEQQHTSSPDRQSTAVAAPSSWVEQFSHAREGGCEPPGPVPVLLTTPPPYGFDDEHQIEFTFVLPPPYPHGARPRLGTRAAPAVRALTDTLQASACV